MVGPDLGVKRINDKLHAIRREDLPGRGLSAHGPYQAAAGAQEVELFEGGLEALELLASRLSREGGDDQARELFQAARNMRHQMARYGLLNPSRDSSKPPRMLKRS